MKAIERSSTAAPGASGRASAIELTDAEVENPVKRSYQCVGMCNVNNKFALKAG